MVQYRLKFFTFFQVRIMFNLKCLNLPNFHYSKLYSNIPISNSYKCSQIRDNSNPHFDYIRQSNMISKFYVFQFKVSDELGNVSQDIALIDVLSGS